MSKRDEFIEDLKQGLDQLNRQVSELESKAQAATGEARQRYVQRMDQLREMAQPAREKLAELSAASEDRWQQLESEAEKVYKAFVHSFNYFKSQVRKPK